MKVELKLAYEDIENVKRLFNEYTISLKVDLSFQDYQKELASLPGKYAYPKGRLYLIYCDGQAVGCGALRMLNQQSCEIKRLYVQPKMRGNHFGEMIIRQLLDDAREIGYKSVYLDTLASLESAVYLYQKLGFYEIEPYYDNPLQEVKYFKIDL